MTLIAWRGPSELDGAPLRLSLTTTPSRNRKTGQMVQSFILRDDMDPLAAIASGQDRSICGDCPLSGLQPDGSRQGRACYVVIRHGPLAVWRGNSKQGGLAEATEALQGKSLRLGAYGEPAAVPLHVWKQLLTGVRRYTGYTHQWPNLPSEWQGILMASVESEADAEKAQALGWRTFRVSATGEPTSREVICPNVTTGRTCIECGACNGTAGGSSPNRRSIVIAAHGNGAKYVNQGGEA